MSEKKAIKANKRQFNTDYHPLSRGKKEKKSLLRVIRLTDALKPKPGDKNDS